MLSSSNIKYTRQELNDLYKQAQKEIRRNSILKIIQHLSECVIKKATQGETVFTEYFPKNKFSDLQNEVIIKIKTIFPDCLVTVTEIDENGVNSTSITFDWSLTNV
jgi:hypothetical protein